MKRTLKKAPLVNVVLHLRFAQVPDLISPVPELVNALHKKMVDLKFPEKIVSETEVVDWVFDPLTQQMRSNKVKRHRLLFRAAGEQQSLEVADSAIILKSTCYTTFNEFYGQFEQVLRACCGVVEGLGKTLLKHLGLRYVNVIVPDKDHQLHELIASDIMPPQLKPTHKHLLGAVLKVQETEPGGTLTLNFEQLQCKENQVHKILPGDLIETDRHCSLVVKGHQSWFNIDSPTYGILDIEHSYQFIGSPEFKLAEVTDKAQQLYYQASEVFWLSITDIAKNCWQYEEL